MKCPVPRCRNNASSSCRGMCMTCYSSAKKRVDAGTTTWEKLEEYGLAKPKENDLLGDALKSKEGS